METKITKKERVELILSNNGATLKNGIYTMNQLQASEMVEDLEANGFTLCSNKSDSSLLNIYDQAKKTKYASLKVEENKPAKVKKAKAEKKAKTLKSYVVFYKAKNGAEVRDEVIENRTSLKSWLKKFNKQLSDINIYTSEDGALVPARQSAWKGEKIAEVKTFTF